MLISGVLICSFPYLVSATCVFNFFVLMRFDISILIFFFSFNKITDFHFDFSFHFVFENSFSEFECAASFFID